MSLGVDDYLAWTPAGMDGAANWLADQSVAMGMSANAIRSAADRGTEGQSGAFIDQRREDAAGIAGRVGELADVLADASRVVRQAGTDLEGAVGRLRDDCRALREEGFVRFDGHGVRDASTGYADSVERQSRRTRATEFQSQLRNRLEEVHDLDEQANHALHEIAGRDVRDRTALGNGDPREVFRTGGGQTAAIGALTGTAAEVAAGSWMDAVLDSGKGETVGGSLLARGLGPIAAGMGFIGAVADRPEGEPLHEAIVAEGVGTVAGLAGGVLGGAVGLGTGGPAGGATGYFSGTLATNMSATAAVRGAFDRAN